MAGIYIHIPFCKQACYYCDFYFSTSQRLKGDFIESLLKEWKKEQGYLGTETIQSIYFGGGTPSLLKSDEISRILEAICQSANVAGDAEITLEANPDDLTPQKVKEISATAINRLSIGVQSFFDEDLKWMNRAHSSAEAIQSIQTTQDAGLNNITIDLIYGVPGMSLSRWQENLGHFYDLSLPHLSAYSLAVEQNTPLYKLIKQGRYTTTDDALSASHFDELMLQMKQADFLHYEISNFAKDEQHIARHNSSYWKGVKYLGLGPSAHSFDLNSRRWNVASLQKYIDGTEQGEVVYTTEQLSEKDRFNEYILTGLRTMWGVDVTKLTEKFSKDLVEYFLKNIQKYIDEGKVFKEDNSYVLSETGKLYADAIASDLFFLD